MKNLILTAVAAMMVLASCTKTKVESIDGPKEIAFKKIEGAMTKATVEKDLAGNTTMGVYAINHGATTCYFENVKFGYNGTANAWVGLNDAGEHTPQYWPQGMYLDFMVYSPYADATTYNIETKKLAFTIKENSSQQTDYLYGDKYYDNTGDVGYNNEKTAISVKLKHALAKISVAVKANVANKFTLTSITINDTQQAGTITITYDGSDKAAGYGTSGTPPSCEVANPEVKYSKVLDFNNQSVSTEASENTKKSYLVFPSDQTSLTVKYKMDPNTAELDANIPLNTASAKWESGKHYVYNITLTANEILFSPSVEEWPTSGNDNYIVDNKTVN